MSPIFTTSAFAKGFLINLGFTECMEALNVSEKVMKSIFLLNILSGI